MKSTTENLYDTHLEILRKNIERDYNEWSANLSHARDLKAYVTTGRKYDRIMKDNSVWGFVAKKDGVHKGISYRMGDVFKAAGLRQPAKHVRGSIFDNSTDWFSWTGPEYLFVKKARLADRK